MENISEHVTCVANSGLVFLSEFAAKIITSSCCIMAVDNISARQRANQTCLWSSRANFWSLNFDVRTAGDSEEIPEIKQAQL